jgi:heterodisulfide reductase subunit A-like polyferredoxin
MGKQNVQNIFVLGISQVFAELPGEVQQLHEATVSRATTVERLAAELEQAEAQKDEGIIALRSACPHKALLRSRDNDNVICMTCGALTDQPGVPRVDGSVVNDLLLDAVKLTTKAGCEKWLDLQEKGGKA